MTDPALDFICNALSESSGQRLLVADEHLDSSLLLSLKTLPDLSLLTNRYDVYRSAQDNNIPCIFNEKY